MYKDDEKRFDIRVLAKHSPTDDASQKELQTHLGALPDVSPKIDKEYRFDFTLLPRKSNDKPVAQSMNESKPPPEDEADASEDE